MVHSNKMEKNNEEKTLAKKIASWFSPQQKGTDRKVFSFFLLLFPSLLIAVMSYLFSGGAVMIVQAIIIFYQAVLLKQFVEGYYGDK